MAVASTPTVAKIVHPSRSIRVKETIWGISPVRFDSCRNREANQNRSTGDPGKRDPQAWAVRHAQGPAGAAFRTRPQRRRRRRCNVPGVQGCQGGGILGGTAGVGFGSEGGASVRPNKAGFPERKRDNHDGRVNSCAKAHRPSAFQMQNHSWAIQS